MSKRVKVWLAYPAFVIVALAMVNFGLVFTRHPTPVPVYVSHPIGMLAGAYLLLVFLLPSMSGRLGIGRVLPPAGPVLASGKCGGRLGRMTFSGRLITVTVYADRLTLRVFPMGEVTIHGSDIESVERGNGRWSRRLSIVHSAPGQTSPVVLASLSEDVATAIAQIQRIPLPEQPNLATATPEDRAAATIAASIPLFIYVIGLLFSIGLGVFGVVQVINGNPGFLMFGLVGLLSGALSIRGWITARRSA